jgi:SAM-dependent methyltransferase
VKKLKRCPVCGKGRLNFAFMAEEKHYGLKHPFKNSRCADCGAVVVDPQPSLRELGPYYAQSYYSFSASDNEGFFRKLLFRVYTAYLGGRGTRLEKACFWMLGPYLRAPKARPGARLLDIGCGAGDYLSFMRRLGFKVQGLEPGAAAVKAARARGLDVRRGTLGSVAFPAKRFDVVTLNHVFEHIGEPRKAMAEIRRILKPGGTLVIGVPSTHSLTFALFGENWSALDTPRHLVNYDPRNLARLAGDFGFECLSVTYKSDSYQFLSALRDLLNRGLPGKETPLVQSRLFSHALLDLALLVPAQALNLLGWGDRFEASFRLKR